MTNRVVSAVLAVFGAVGSLLALAFVPWAHYADIDIPLSQFPGWSLLPAGMIILYCGVGWQLFARRSGLSIVLGVACIGAAFTTIDAAALMSRYDDVSALFPGPAPAVFARLGLGGPLAIVGALLGIASAMVARTKPNREAMS